MIVMSLIVIILAIVLARVYRELTADTELELRLNQIKPQIDSTLISVMKLQYELDSLKNSFERHDDSLQKLSSERDSFMHELKKETMDKLTQLKGENDKRQITAERLNTLRKRSKDFQ